MLQCSDTTASDPSLDLKNPVPIAGSVCCTRGQLFTIATDYLLPTSLTWRELLIFQKPCQIFFISSVSAQWVMRVLSLQKSHQFWRCRGLNPGPFTCKANALPLRYIPHQGCHRQCRLQFQLAEKASAKAWNAESQQQMQKSSLP